ncbi:hypothetical protein C8R43DRAFT_314220 [Mycena crocata]|nr:hypothetical protein C8R43DRAFT_314220 [Mycena crocata]
MKSTPLRSRLDSVESQLIHLNQHLESIRQGSSAFMEIVLKEERRTRLTREKETLQRCLNSIVFPILTIPVEVVSQIFLYCLPDAPAPLHGPIAPVLLTHICRYWREIAFGEFRLWNSLEMTGQNTLALVRGSFDDDKDEDPCDEDEFCDPLPKCPPHYFDRFWKHLTSFSGQDFTLYQLLELLRHVPHLTRCEINDFSEPWESSHVGTPLLRIHLASLVVRDVRRERGIMGHNLHDFQLLRWLHLPALRSLDLGWCFFYPGTQPGTSSFLNFLSRSPGIQYFAAKLDGDHREVNADVVLALDRMPSLTHLALCMELEISVHLIRKLADPLFLPCIRDIILTQPAWDECFSWEEEHTTHLVGVLNSRQEASPDVAQLLELGFPFDGLYGATDGLEDALRELRAKGMKVYSVSAEAA